MDKLGQAVVGVVDFFAALLPGVATLVTLLWLGGGTHRLLAVGEPGYLVFFVAAYLLGQGLNGVGSMVLDPVYDRFYNPESGWLSQAKSPWWRAPFGPLLQHNYPGGKTTSKATSYSPAEVTSRVREALAETGFGGAYQGARAYVRLTNAAAFSDIERLEAEQKMIRSMLMGAALVAGCVGGASLGLWSSLATHTITLAWVPIGGAWVLAFLRFLAVRLKTVQRTYLYFDLVTRHQLRSDAGPE